MDELNDNLSLVCDGGIDNDVPPLPPQVKVNPMSALLLVLLFYRTLIHLIIDHCCWSLCRKIISSLGMY